MSTNPNPEAEHALDGERLGSWLAGFVDPPLTAVEITRLPGGYSSGAWRIDAVGPGHAAPMVLKAPEVPSVVYRRDAVREARILDALARSGAPVPGIVAIDEGDRAVGRPCFVMEFVEGRGLVDASPGSYHNDPWLREAGPDVQRAIWESFHDALAALHSVDSTKVPDAAHGPDGVADVISYWREALLDVADAAIVPRQLAALDWLLANRPPDADDTPSVCMGDARLVNCLIEGTEVRALVDFEVAYVGNPAADIGYSLFIDGQQRKNIADPLPGMPSHDETWARWSRATGRSIEHRNYWTAFGAMVLVVTATRAMIQWGFAGATVESDSPLVTAWEATLQRAENSGAENT